MTNFEISTPESEQPTGGSVSKVMSALVALFLLVAVGSAGAAYYYYSQVTELKQNPEKVAEQENKDLIAKIGVLILLPTDEQPTIATVADPAKLKDQPFFAKAGTGDKVLIYTNARKAILYSPIQNKIIEVAPVNIGQAAGANTEQQATP